MAAALHGSERSIAEEGDPTMQWKHAPHIWSRRQGRLICMPGHDLDRTAARERDSTGRGSDQRWLVVTHLPETTPLRLSVCDPRARRGRRRTRQVRTQNLAPETPPLGMHAQRCGAPIDRECRVLVFRCGRRRAR